MNPPEIPLRSRLLNNPMGLIDRLLLLFITLAATLLPVGAQESQHSSARGVPAESRTGQSTPSTYARDKIETVNLANGNFTMSIPLATVGGRGSAGFVIALTYNSKVWSAQLDTDPGVSGPGTQIPPLDHYSAMYEKEVDFEPGVAKLGGGWTILAAPGIKGKLIGVDHMPTTVCTNQPNGIPDCGFKYALTKMWMTLPDGSQVELRDSLTEGAPSLTTQIDHGYHLLVDRDRGRVWHSFDGSNITFVRDANDPPQAETFYPSGWVFVPDGTRLRMDTGICSKIIDSNGNFITIAGGTYTDELGRQTLLQATESTVTVTVKGYMGLADKVITMDLSAIGNLENLRTDFQSLPRPFTTGDALHDASGNYFPHTISGAHTDLFTESEGIRSYGTTDGDDVGLRKAVTKLNLPDGRSMRFRYNQYGEVAEIVYPSGGVSQIDYVGSITTICEVSAPIHGTLNRRVSQRRSLTDGTNVDATWIYTDGGEVIDGITRPTRSVEAHQGSATGSLLSSEKHIFLALNSEYRTCLPSSFTGTGNEKWENAREFRTEIQTGTGTIITSRQWQQRAPLVWGNDVGLSYNDYAVNRGQEQAPNDPRVEWEETTLEDGKTKRVEFAYDNFNNVTSMKEYDFGTPGSPGPLLRQTVRQYAGSAPTQTINGYCYTNLNPLDSSCGNGLASDPTKIIHQKHVLLSETIKDGSNNQKAYTEFEYDNYSGDPNHAALTANSGMTQYDGSQFSIFASSYQPRGNVTKTTLWAGASSYIYSFAQYNNAGNIIWSKDPKGNVSTISYADNFGAGSNPDAGLSGPFGPTYAMATLGTNALNHQTKTQFDFTRGVPTGVKDPNGVISQTEYDLLGRPTRITSALGLPEQTVSEVTYPSLTANFTTVSQHLDSTRWLASKKSFDGFDRVTTSWQAEDGQHASVATYTIRTDTGYDGLGRVKTVSNPYRPAGEVAQYTTTVYDLEGRVTSVTTPDNAVVSTSYNGNNVTVTDQAGKARKSVTDALGRLIQVYEDPAGLNYQTTYAYDVLDNLTTVTQGTQTRSFVYDSLKRLSTATNPESGTITYQYDNNSNLIQKTDARGIVSTYGYDALNRNTTIDYSDTAAINPDVSRFYDGATNGKGRLWYSYAGGNESAGSNVEKTLFDSYDALGRPLILKQLFKLNGVWSAPYQSSRAYNLAGNVTSQTYPSGHSVTYNYDGAGRLADKDAQNLAFTGNLGDGVLRTYSRGISYAAAGQLKQEQFGTTTPVYDKLFYNSRQQLAEILASTTGGDSSWNRGKIINNYSLQCSGAGCNATDNNGNLRKQEVYIPGNDQVSSYTSWYQQYDYDALNLLLRVHEYTGNQSLDWQQEYVYDRWGNRTIHQTNTYGTGINKKDFTVNTANNRLGVPAGQSGVMSYDAAGNLTTDSYTGFGSRLYDAENKMTAAQDNSGVWAYYTYNADGQRTRRKSNNQETWQVYGFDGELLAEYPVNGAANQPTKEYGYRDGQLLISAEAGNASAPPAFADDFNDNSLNANSWSVYYPGTSPTVSEQSQQLQMTLSPNTAAYNGVYSNATYDLTNRMVQVESVQAVSQAGWCENYLEVELNANNYFMIQVGAGNMILRSRVNGVNDQTSIPFDAAANRFWRIRHDQSANQIYFETSANDSVWLTRKTVTPGFALTSLRFDLLAGAWGTGNGSPGAAKYDNFKLLPSSAGSVSLSVPNAGFESPVLGNGNFQYGPSGGSWSFANGGGISGMNSPFTGAPSSAPDGVQVAFIQATGTISQSISGFQASANYVITFSAIQRTNCCNTSGQDVGVYIDSTLVGTFHPGNTAYVEYSTAPFTITTGAHTVKFAGLNGAPTGETAFIDKVRITGTPKPGYGVEWLLTDQLGTPRMVFDESGALANVKRHDYLPFGEELFAGTGDRTTAQGYSANDGVRQHFTQKERDNETGLDYFLARYYSSVQGRFTGVDTAGPELTNPQTLNKYAYCLNNPLRMVDRNGRYGEDVHYELTRVLAYAAGYSLNNATEIARQTQAPDNPGDSRNPFNSVESRELYHFTSESRRAEMWGDFTGSANFTEYATGKFAADSGEMMQRLGEYMHALQDSYSHEGYNAIEGQAIDYLKGKDPYAADYTDTDPAKANRMAETSFTKLVDSKLYVSGHPGIGPMSNAVSYNAIRGLVDRFNRASDPAKKQEILKQIENKVTLARHLQESQTRTETMRMKRRKEEEE